MRIGISGSHATGKSTLVAELAHRLVDYVTVDETYHVMVANGELFSSPPSADDYESMIVHSMNEIALNDVSRVVFDRTPLDYLAYLWAVSGKSREVIDRWLPDVRDALRSLDAVVFVPIEQPDRIATSAIELPKLRRHVDALLFELLIEDAWHLEIRALQVSGTTAARARQVFDWMPAE